MEQITVSAAAGTAKSALPGLGLPAGQPRGSREAEQTWQSFLRLDRADRRAVPAAWSSCRLEVIRKRDALFRRSLAVADVAALGIALAVSSLLLADGGLAWGAAAALPVFVLIVKARGLYDRDEHLLHKTTLDEVPALFTLSTVAALLLWLSGGAVIDGGLERPQVLGVWLSLLVLLVCLRTLARTLASRRAPAERCLLVGDARSARYVADKLAINSAVRAELVAVVPMASVTDGSDEDGLPAALGPILDEKNVDRVIIAGGGRDNLLYTIRELKADGVKVSVLPEASRVAGSSVELDDLGGITLLGMRRFAFTRSSRLIKRAFDIVGAGLALAVLSPLLLLAAIAIKLDSPGPILFRQRRVGRDEGVFEVLKLRSMREDADACKGDFEHLNEGAEGLFKITDDPRVTRVGRHLRRFQIDELPQLFNVLRGDMSLVGPRPLVEEEDSQIDGWYRRRLDVPPGITGHWQVLGSSRGIPIKEMVKLDYLYVANWSLWGDIRLLLQTIGFLLARRAV